MDHYMDAVVKLTGDSSMKVRRAAFLAIVQLWGSLSTPLGSRYCDALMPVIFLALGNFAIPDLQAQGALALVFLSERCAAAECVAPYLDSVIILLLQILEDVDQQEILLCTVLKSVGSFALASKEFFIDYYDSVMPRLQSVLSSSFEKGLCMVASSAIECICRVSAAVPNSKFSHHSKQILEQMISIQLSGLEIDSPIRSSIILGWVDLYKCLGPEFVFYMKNTMPFFIETAAKTFDYNADVVDQSCSVLEDQIFPAKAAVCKMISLSATEMKENFHPWISQAVDAIVPLLKFKSSDQVREAAISAIPELVCSAQLSKEKGLLSEECGILSIDKFVDEAFSILLKTLREVPVAGKTCVVIIKALTDCVQVIGIPSILELELMVDVVKHILRNLADINSEAVREVNQQCLSIDDHEKMKQEEEIRVDTICQIGSCLGYLVAALKEGFLPYFDELFPFVVPLMGSQRSYKERNIGYQIFNQVILHTKQASVVYFTTFIPFLIKVWTDNDKDMLEVSATGICLCAEYGGNEFKPYANVILSNLKSVLELPDNSSLCNPDTLSATASAIEKIFNFHHDCINIDKNVCMNLH